MKLLRVYLIIIVALLIPYTCVMAEDSRYTLANEPDHVVEISTLSGRIQITGYSGNEVILIRHTPAPAEQPSATGDERARGLRPVGGSATDNTGLGYQVQASERLVRISAVAGKTDDLELRVPDNTRLVIRQAFSAQSAARLHGAVTSAQGATVIVRNNPAGDSVSRDHSASTTSERPEPSTDGATISVNNHKGDIQISATMGSIRLQDITGPVTVNTVSGNVEALFTELSQQRPSTLSSVNGLVDVSLPPRTRSELRMSTVTGSIYSDLDANFDVRESPAALLQFTGGSAVRGSLNGGGVPLELKVVSGNIYVRAR